MISELLTLVCPGPAHGGPGQPPQRASDADRDLAADILCAAVGDGRLTLDELDERLGAALSARTITELAVRIADLNRGARWRVAAPRRGRRIIDRRPGLRRNQVLVADVAAVELRRKEVVGEHVLLCHLEIQRSFARLDVRVG